MDPMLSAQALGMIGGFNVLGSLFFGWAGQRWNKLALLGGIYIFRSLALPGTSAAADAGDTLVFAAIMGFLWLGVGPLVAGAVVDMFGLSWQAMIQGLAFVSHQLGSFLGAYGGGLIYDSLGSYTMAWRIGVALGLAAGIVQVAFALIRPSAPPMLKTAYRAVDAHRQNENGAARPRSSQQLSAILLDLGFLEFNVLARDRVVLLLDELVGHGARILLGDVVEAGVRRGNELDLDGDRFGHVKNLKNVGNSVPANRPAFGRQPSV